MPFIESALPLNPALRSAMISALAVPNPMVARQTTIVAQTRDKDLGARAAANFRFFKFDCEIVCRAPWLVLPVYNIQDKHCFGKEKMCFCTNSYRIRNNQC